MILCSLLSHSLILSLSISEVSLSDFYDHKTVLKPLDKNELARIFRFKNTSSVEKLKLANSTVGSVVALQNRMLMYQTIDPRKPLSEIILEGQLQQLNSQNHQTKIKFEHVWGMNIHKIHIKFIF